MDIIKGKVIRGAGYGRTLGFPTANLDRRQYVREKMKIRFGVYAGKAEISKSEKLKVKSKKWKAGIVIGPIDKKGLPRIEAHLINFKGNLYGKKINLQLIKYIRAFKKFENEDGLKTQIQKDIERIKKLI